MPPNPYLPIFEILRGSIVESIHFGAVAVVDAAGHLVASFADPQAVTSTRSSAKPFQALPFIMPDALSPGSSALGIAIKISDGDHANRARSGVALEVLKQLDALSQSQLASLSHFGPEFPLHN